MLAALEKHFIESGFDLKSLVRLITQSSTYQLSATPNEYNVQDAQNYSRFYPKRLQAEVLLDAIDDLTGTETTFANMPPGTRAVALPDNSYNRGSAFLRVFGRPEGASVCECERVEASSLSQSLHLMNDGTIKAKLADGNGRATKLSQSDKPPAEKVKDLYLAAFSREPRADELETAVAYLAEPRVDASGKSLSEAAAAKENWQDLIWALMNTKEFLFNH